MRIIPDVEEDIFSEIESEDSCGTQSGGQKKHVKEGYRYLLSK